MLRKGYDATLKAVEGERAVVAMISTTAVDRDGEVMLPSGMDAKDYRANPVVMLGHSQQYDPRALPIGTAAQIKRLAKGVEAKIVFANRPASLPDGEEWLPDTILELFRQKVLRAFSIGFLADEVKDAAAAEIRRFGEGLRRVISKWRLMEISVVAVPSNQEALAMAVSKGICPRDSWIFDGEIGLKAAKRPTIMQVPIGRLEMPRRLCCPDRLTVPRSA